ncbi:hypothetical protein JR316_0013240 [Psilocybe cubensis]|uniref:Uncharacterized protein n=2 Tax=Psilocybe cubensis TaxID=181762 RepID=A0ACB8GGD5_PSICU|nr:hypothetical protein JR316_0013240 [Psilocybe cubensis]KAH9474775.1 hypothetical protein JR316_0013240 [Psilocybe cubensis]
MFSKFVVALTLASTAFATVFITEPFGVTTYAAGKEATIRWKDDGNAPSLAEFGPAKISIYVGNSRQQTSLQLLADDIDVSKNSSLAFTPNATIGPNSSEYFIRVESLSLKDPSQPTIPALAFSARFTLTGMTGTFSAAVQSQIAGQSTAPLPSVTSTTTSTTTSATSTSSSSSRSSTGTASNASASPSTGSAMGIVNPHAGLAGALLSALVGITLF